MSLSDICWNKQCLIESDISAHHGQTATPVSTMPPQTTPCPSFKDTLKDGTTTWVLFCRRRSFLKRKQFGERTWMYQAVHCSGGNIGMKVLVHQTEMKIIWNCLNLNKIYC